MQQRKSGRRKSIMIVEKDRTQEEIDKRPADKKDEKGEMKEEMKEANEETGEMKEAKEEKDETEEKKEEMKEAKEEKDEKEEKKEEKDKPEETKDKLKDKPEEKNDKPNEDNLDKKTEPADPINQKDPQPESVNKNGSSGDNQPKTPIRPEDDKPMETSGKENKYNEDGKEMVKNTEEGMAKENNEEEMIKKNEENINEKINEENINEKVNEEPMNETEQEDQQREQPKVHFSEEKNTSMEVEKDAGKSIPSPTNDEIATKKGVVDEEIKSDSSEPKEQLDRITNAVSLNDLKDTCELYLLKSGNKVLIEGPIRKRMFICSCFWHSRYFVLTDEGVLCYFRSLDGKSRGHVKIREEIETVRRVNEANDCKILLKYRNGTTESIKFGDETVRDKWNDKLRYFLRSE